MPIEIKIVDGLLWITLRGAVTAKEFALHAAELARIEQESEISPARFSDLSETTALPDYQTIALFADVRSRAKLKNKVKSALFAPSSFHFGMGRQYQELIRNPEIEVRVFRDKDEALKWLGWSEPRE